MKGNPPVAAELSWPQVHAFRLLGHHLIKRAPKKDLARVVGDIGGAQAQLMSAAELQVAVRVACNVADVRAALWTDKTLVKTWLMRGTLHLVPSEDLPIYTAAMGKHGLRNLNAWLKYTQLTEPELTGLFEAIGDSLDGRNLTREELIATVGRGRPEKIREVLKSGWGGMLKPVARRGLLCFGPNRGQSVTFVRPRQWLDTWREVEPRKAQAEVARRYLRAYGPATKQDFSRWWGAWTGVGREAWATLADELVPVSIEGSHAEMLASDLHTMSRASVGTPVQLLPTFDPYLMGHANRDHLFDAAHRARVSRVAGWISAVVLVDGHVAATWTHSVAKQTLRVVVDPLQRLPHKTRPAIADRAEEIATALGLAGAEVTFA